MLSRSDFFLCSTTQIVLDFLRNFDDNHGLASQSLTGEPSRSNSLLSIKV